MGRRFRKNMPPMVAKAAKRMVSSYDTGKANIGLNSGLPPTTSGYSDKPSQAMKPIPVQKPVMPPAREKRGSLERGMPIAASRPWIGNDVSESQREYPASRTCSQA